MDATRIKVPVTLREPHFEDEATVVSARQVVPLDEARNHDRQRKLLVILPMLLGALFCGALGAIAINYFERRASVPTASQSSQAGAKEQEQQTEPSASQDNHETTSADAQNQTPDTSQASGSVSVSEPSTADRDEKPTVNKAVQILASAKKPSTPPDPKQLVRQRRVHPPANELSTSQNDKPKSRGAARIQDIFTGPNP